MCITARREQELKGHYTSTQELHLPSSSTFYRCGGPDYFFNFKTVMALLAYIRIRAPVKSTDILSSLTCVDVQDKLSVYLKMVYHGRLPQSTWPVTRD
jgi:hypothetical protein